jgi:hypothetical protein
MNKIIGLKLLSGEEIIAGLEEKTSDSYILNSPAAVVMHPDAPGQMMLSRWCGYASSGSFEIPFGSVTATFDVIKQMEDYYIQGVSGLALPSDSDVKQIITG